MNNQPKISVVIPVYNAELYIRRCLKSVMIQSYKNFEVILINDGSTDKSARICREFVEKDERFTLISQENQGPSAARNAGISISSGSFLAFIDADDYVAEKYLEKLLTKITQSKSQLVCSGYFEISKFNERPLPLNDFFVCAKQLLAQDEFLIKIFKGLGGVLWGKLFDASIIRENNIQLNPEIRMSEDLVFVLEYTFFCDVISVINEPLYFYNRLNESGISQTTDSKYIKDLILTSEAIETTLLENGYSREYFQKINNKRVWNVLRKICFDLATSNMSVMDKKQKILLVLKDPFIANCLSYLEENKSYWKFHKFLLQKRMIITYILYCEFLQKLMDFKRKIK